jgi:thiosulfate reductase cytochrome b subunit
MATLAQTPDSVAVAIRISRHSPIVRITHWLTVIAFLALLLSGVEILISHPRFYWGETGNVLTPPLFQLHIPSSREIVPTGYPYVLPDQNGWSRYLHFEAAWLAVLTGLLYFLYGSLRGHFRKNLLPAPGDLSWRAIRSKLTSPRDADAASYNALQRLTYLAVIFVLFPLVIWTGLALSPAIDSAFPHAVTLLGGRQSARTLHFFVSLALAAFFLIHIVMVAITGFRARMRAMITGRASQSR